MERKHLQVLSDMNEHERAAVERQVAAERAAAIESVRGRLAFGAAAPVFVIGFAGWCGILYRDAVALGATEAVAQLLLGAVVYGISIALLVLVVGSLVAGAAYWLMGGK